MNVKSLFTLATAALLVGCATVGDVFGDLDVDGDGLFEETEYAELGNDFEAWDLNRDTWIGEDEFEAGFENVGLDDWDGVFADFDDDRNRYLNDDEFFDDEEWGLWDTNRDGVLDDDEWGI